MKKLALLAASLICFAGCARNDTGDLGATDTTSSDTTATGAAGTSESGSDTATSGRYSATNENSMMTDTNSITPSLERLNNETNNFSGGVGTLGTQSGSQPSALDTNNTTGTAPGTLPATGTPDQNNPGGGQP